MEGTKSLIWGFGKIVIFTGMLACIGCLIFWLRVEKKGIIFQLKFWTTQSTQKLALTYFHLLSSYILSFTSCAYVLSSPKLLEIISYYPYEVVMGIIVAMSICTTLIEFIPYCSRNNLIKIFTWFVHSTILGFPIAYFGTQICTNAALQTIMMLGLSSLVSFLASGDFYKVLESYLTNLYYIVTVSSIFCVIIESPASTFSLVMLAINFFGGIILYFGVFITNTQFLINDIITNEKYDPVYTSAVMYLCTMNLYIRNALYKIVQCSKI